MSTCVVTDGRLRTPMNAEIQGNLTLRPKASGLSQDRPVGARTSEQSSHRLPAVPRSTPKFVEQFFGRPGRLTPHVPLGQRRQRLVFGQSEPSDETAAHAKRVNVS